MLTIRRGVLEIVWDEPIIGTPEPVGTLTTTSEVWRALALDTRGRAAALLGGDLTIEGGVLAVQRFLGRFDTEIRGSAERLP